MKNLMLILLLVIAVTEINGEYEFGDIIVFPRLCTVIPVYNHYAIYVGPSSGVDIGQGDNDIFQRAESETSKWKSACRFGKIEKTRGWKKERKDNYFDGVKGIKPGTQQSIIKRINETIENCDKYKLFRNNCEHLATYVRYGLRVSMQQGSLAKFMFDSVDLDSPEIREILDRIQKDEEEAAQCRSVGANANKQAFSQSILSVGLALLWAFNHITSVTEKLLF